MWRVINAIFVILKCVEIPHFCLKFWSFFSYFLIGLSYESIKRLVSKILYSTFNKKLNMGRYLRCSMMKTMNTSQKV